MAKKFVRVKQTYYVDCIMDIKDGETEQHIYDRIHEHCINAGGFENVIVQDGGITFKVKWFHETPTKKDEDTYEVID